MENRCKLVVGCRAKILPQIILKRINIFSHDDSNEESSRSAFRVNVRNRLGNSGYRTCVLEQSVPRVE